MAEGKYTPRLTSAQSSFLRRLYLDGGRSPLHNASFRTAIALNDKGMVKVEVLDPVTGRVAITEDGKRVAKAIIALLSSPGVRPDISSALSKEEGQ